MRTKSTVINSMFAITSYIILFFGPFFVIPLVKNYIGTDILGLEKTFIDMVYFARLGTIYGVYKLYKPISNNDINKITIFLSFYRKILTFAAILIIFVGLLFVPFIPNLIKTVDSSKLFLNPQIIYVLYLLDVSLTYLFGHKRAMIIADQKNYITTLCRTICRVLMFFCQALVIYFFRSFSIYVIIKLCSTFLESMLINFQYKKLYGHIPTKTLTKMSKSDKSDLLNTLKSVLCHKFSYEAFFSVSTIIVMTCINATATGVYYAYIQLTTGLLTITSHVFNSVTSSFGNYLAEKKPEDTYRIYRKIYFLNFYLFSFFSVLVICTASIFINIWVGEDVVLPLFTVALLTLYFYVLGMKQSINMAKFSAGIFKQDRYLAILEPILNLFLSYKFSAVWGLNGVILASIFTILLISFWTQPYLVYKNAFKRSCIFYYKKYIIYFGLTLFECTLSYILCRAFSDFNLYSRLFINLFICISIPNLINCLLFKNTEEFIYFKNLLKNMLRLEHFKVKFLKEERNILEEK